MAVAIDFNHQARLGTIKVDDVWTNGMLAAKFITGQVAITQELPEFFFGGCEGLAQLLRPAADFGMNA